jgi:hypothetical protein
MSAALARDVRWSAWGGAEAGLEHLDLVPDRQGMRASGVVIGATERGRFGLSYRLLIDPAWRLREAILATTAGRELTLRADGSGSWTDADGCALPEIEGCVDIDVEATPFTNTLPIRRLALRADESAHITVAYVSLPDLALSTARQRYTRLSGTGAYRFESVGSGFTAELTVDAQGLVCEYPGLFRRL